MIKIKYFMGCHNCQQEQYVVPMLHESGSQTHLGRPSDLAKKEADDNNFNVGDGRIRNGSYNYADADNPKENESNQTPSKG